MCVCVHGWVWVTSGWLISKLVPTLNLVQQLFCPRQCSSLSFGSNNVPLLWTVALLSRDAHNKSLFGFRDDSCHLLCHLGSRWFHSQSQDGNPFQSHSVLPQQFGLLIRAEQYKKRPKLSGKNNARNGPNRVEELHFCINHHH